MYDFCTLATIYLITYCIVCLIVCGGMHMPGYMSTSYKTSYWKLVFCFFLFLRQGSSVLHDIGHLTLKLPASSHVATSYLKKQYGNYRFTLPHPTIYVGSGDRIQVI